MVCGRCKVTVGDLQPAVQCGECHLHLCGPCIALAIERRKKLNAAKASGEALANGMRALQMCCGGAKALSGFAVDAEILTDAATVVCGRCKGTVGDLQPVVQCGECKLL